MPLHDPAVRRRSDDNIAAIATYVREWEISARDLLVAGILIDLVEELGATRAEFFLAANSVVDLPGAVLNNGLAQALVDMMRRWDVRIERDRSRGIDDDMLTGAVSAGYAELRTRRTTASEVVAR